MSLLNRRYFNVESCNFLNLSEYSTCFKLISNFVALFVLFLKINEQRTDEQTNRWTTLSRKAPVFAAGLNK